MVTADDIRQELGRPEAWFIPTARGQGRPKYTTCARWVRRVPSSLMTKELWRSAAHWVQWLTPQWL